MQNVIYKLTSPSGKVYIGQAKCFKKRMKSYQWYKAREQSKLNRAILKYGWENFTKEVIDGYHGNEVKEGLNALETYWITHYDSCNTGYNCTAVGGSRRGSKSSEETRRKISLALKGRVRPKAETEKAAASNTGKKRSAETRLLMSLLKMGNKMSQENKEKIIIANKNKKFSEEQRKKFSESAKSRGISKETRAKMIDSRRKNIAIKKLKRDDTITPC